MVLVPERRRALERIDPRWCPAWQRAYAIMRRWWLEQASLVD
ncbi:hypothetical protein ACFWA9_04255 [Kitasatospora sp. NPDC059973]